VERAVAACLTHFGAIDVLVNCAGVGYFGPVETMPIESFDAVVKTNLHGMVNVTQAALPALKKSRGIIVNVSSGLAMRALPFLSAYAGTKSMLNALSDGMRLELAPYGIRVLTYCPPHTDSGFDQRSLKGAGMEKAALREVGRQARTEAVAAGIAEAIGRERWRTGGRTLLIMNALAPRLVDRMFRKMALSLGKQTGMYGEKS
jgi:NAD(P)-dependent dehydrogenase (short-subunit alcohol dehydrogenase family)